MNNDVGKHTISVLVENRPGVLARVAGLFARRGFNIDSLAVCATEDPTVSRMTVVTTGDDKDLAQVIKQLNKLIDVVKLQDFTEGNFIEREMMFVKVRAEGGEQRSEIKRLSEIFRARIIDVTDTTFCIELTGSGDKLEAYIKAMHENNILEVVRSGSMGILRGEKALTI